MKSTDINDDYGYFECPACGDLIYADGARFEEHRHCLSCGQKLDWRNDICRLTKQLKKIENFVV